MIAEFQKEWEKKISDFDNAKVRCGLIGPAGSGKSSLINAITGEKIARVGSVETTSDPQDHIHKGITFTDLPGCGTVKWPKDSYIQSLGLLSFDCFLLITAHRFTENDAFLFRELSSVGKPCFVIRNMFDRAVEDELLDNNLSESETSDLIKNDILANLAPSFPNDIYLTSARRPEKYDLRKLIDDIIESLDGIKRQRFIADMAAYGEEALKKKREVAENLILPFAGLSALNSGLNQVPGLDIAADITLLIELGKRVAAIYGLNSEHIEYIKRVLGPEAAAGIFAKIAQVAASYLAKDGIILLLKKIGTRTVIKQGVKWAPIFGQLLAAGIGYQSTFMLGEQLVDEAESLAKEILDEIQKKKDIP